MKTICIITFQLLSFTFYAQSPHIVAKTKTQPLGRGCSGIVQVTFYGPSVCQNDLQISTNGTDWGSAGRGFPSSCDSGCSTELDLAPGKYYFRVSMHDNFCGPNPVYTNTDAVNVKNPECDAGNFTYDVVQPNYGCSGSIENIVYTSKNCVAADLYLVYPDLSENHFTGNNIGGLEPGNYELHAFVPDGGCSIQQSITIQEPSCPSLMMTYDPPPKVGFNCPTSITHISLKADPPTCLGTNYFEKYAYDENMNQIGFAHEDGTFNVAVTAGHTYYLKGYLNGECESPLETVVVKSSECKGRVTATVDSVIDEDGCISRSVIVNYNDNYDKLSCTGPGPQVWYASLIDSKQGIAISSHGEYHKRIVFPDVLGGEYEVLGSRETDVSCKISNTSVTVLAGMYTFYRDGDGDGYGDLSTPISACIQPGGYVTNNTDCDDADFTVHPGAEEVCNQKDDNCDGLKDNVLSLAGDQCPGDDLPVCAASLSSSLSQKKSAKNSILKDAELKNFDIKVIPNPNKGNFKLITSFSEKEQLITAILYDALGKQVWKYNYAHSNGNLSKDIYLENKITSGTYLLVVQTNKMFYKKKVVISK